MEKVICDKSLNAEEEILHYDEVVNLIQSNIELSGMEVVLANTMGRETVLRTYLNEIKRQKLVRKARAFMRLTAKGKYIAF